MPLCRLISGPSQRESPTVTLRRTIAAVEAMALIVLIDELEKVFAGLEGGRDPSRCGLRRFIMLGERTSPASWWRPPTTFNLPPELLRKGRFDETFFVDPQRSRPRSSDPLRGAAAIPKRCRSRLSPSAATSFPAPSSSS